DVLGKDKDLRPGLQPAIASRLGCSKGARTRLAARTCPAIAKRISPSGLRVTRAEPPASASKVIPPPPPASL
ncbi:MAG: hypothetical protein AAF958_05170, partial [Planctomycetota bacterium]